MYCCGCITQQGLFLGLEFGTTRVWCRVPCLLPPLSKHSIGDEADQQHTADHLCQLKKILTRQDEIMPEKRVGYFCLSGHLCATSVNYSQNRQVRGNGLRAGQVLIGRAARQGCDIGHVSFGDMAHEFQNRTGVICWGSCVLTLLGPECLVAPSCLLWLCHHLRG